MNEVMLSSFIICALHTVQSYGNMTRVASFVTATSCIQRTPTTKIVKLQGVSLRVVDNPAEN